MSQEKQIDELRGVLWLNPYVRLGSHNAHMIAQYLHNEGYRKQSKGEWVGTHHLKHCSKCGNVVNFNNVSRWLYKFCPGCGSKMKERIEHEQERNTSGE